MRVGGTCCRCTVDRTISVSDHTASTIPRASSDRHPVGSQFNKRQDSLEGQEQEHDIYDHCCTPCPACHVKSSIVCSAVCITAGSLAVGGTWAVGGCVGGGIWSSL